MTRDRAAPSAITAGGWSVDEAVEGGTAGTDRQELWVYMYRDEYVFTGQTNV